MTHSLRALAFGVALALTLTACDSVATPGTGSAVDASGTLTNSFDRPVDGASMTFTSTMAGKSSAAMASVTTTTNASGGFTLQVPAGTYTVTITHPAYGSITLTATVSASGQVTFSAPATGSGGLSTILVNALNGQAVASATAYCSSSAPTGRSTAARRRRATTS